MFKLLLKHPADYAISRTSFTNKPSKMNTVIVGLRFKHQKDKSNSCPPLDNQTFIDVSKRELSVAQP